MWVWLMGQCSCSTIERRANWKQVITDIGSLFCDSYPGDERGQMEWRTGEIIIRVVVLPFAINLIWACPRVETISWATLFVMVGRLPRLLYSQSNHFEPLSSSPSMQPSSSICPHCSVSVDHYIKYYLRMHSLCLSLLNDTVRNPSHSCGSFVILAFHEEKCVLGPSAVIKAILTTELIPDWPAWGLASVTLPLREKAIPFKDFPAHYFPTSSLSPLNPRFPIFFFFTAKSVSRRELISSTKGHRRLSHIIPHLS